MSVDTVELKFKEILYACLEEMKSTRAALYLMESDGNYSLKTYYGFTKKDYLAEKHLRDSAIIQLMALERKAFYYNSLSEAGDLGPLLTRGNTKRILVAPIYLDRTIGFIDIRDKAGKSLFDDQDIIIADGIAMRFGRLMKQLKQKVEESVHKSVFDISTPEPNEFKPSGEDLHQKIVSLITSPSEKVLHPVTQPPQEFARNVRSAVTSLLSLEGFVTLVVIFQTSKGTFVIQGGRTPLTGTTLQQLKDEGIAYTLNHFKDVNTGDGFFTHRYFPEGEVATEGQLRRQANMPVVVAPWARIFLHIFTTDKPPKETVGALNGLIPLIKRTLALELDSFLTDQTLTHLLEKYVDPGLEKYSSLKVHSLNVSHLARDFCLQLQINEEEVNRITTAALLHDVGMRELDYDNLYHKRQLTDGELQLLKQHPKVGAYLIQDLPFHFDVYSLVYYHHERYDGTGYPGQLMGNTIPLGARIIHILEAWDAMTSPESYRPTVPPNQALEIMRSKAGIQFDPDLVQRFNTFVQAKNLISQQTKPDKD